MLWRWPGRPRPIAINDVPITEIVIFLSRRPKGVGVRKGHHSCFPSLAADSMTYELQMYVHMYVYIYNYMITTYGYRLLHISVCIYIYISTYYYIFLYLSIYSMYPHLSQRVDLKHRRKNKTCLTPPAASPTSQRIWTHKLLVVSVGLACEKCLEMRKV